MLIRLTDIIDELTRRLVALPDTFEAFQDMRINVQQWPDCHARTVASRYISLRSAENHDFAAHIVAEDALALLKPCSHVPHEPAAIGPLYRDKLLEWRIKRLADELSVAPLPRAQELLHAFLDDEKTSTTARNVFDQIGERLKSVIAAHEAGTAMRHIPRWPRLSEMIGGFDPGRVTMLVAETGFGKTNLALGLAQCASEVGPVLFVNMEMTADDLLDRIIYSGAGMRFDEYKHARFSKDQMAAQSLADFSDQMKNRVLLFTDGLPMSVDEIAALARSTRREHGGLFMLFIDYDQKIDLALTRDTPEWKALQLAMQSLESLAKRLEVHIVIAAQANQDGDPSGSKRSKYSASTVLRFFKSNERPCIQAIKNRFGPHGAAVWVVYDAARSAVREDGVADIRSTMQRMP